MNKNESRSYHMHEIQMMKEHKESLMHHGHERHMIEREMREHEERHKNGEFEKGYNGR